MASSQLPFPDGLLGAGVVIGHVTSATARVWVRCAELGPHTLRYASPHASGSVPVLPDPARDRVAVVELGELAPDVNYRLDLEDAQGRSVLDPGLAPALRTLPADTERLCFGFMSCSLPLRCARDGALERAPVAQIYDDMLAILAAKGARFVLNLGDQIYADELPPLNLWTLAKQSPDHTQAARARALFFEAYRGAWAIPALARLRARIPQYMIWDDHELRDDWGSRPLYTGAAGRLEAALWSGAVAGYEAYQHALNPPTDEGVYHYAFRVGGFCFFVLDLRGQRAWAAGRLLGDRQWRDLEAWLVDTERAALRFLVSSVPLHHLPERIVTPVTRWLGTGFTASLVPSTFYDRWCAARFAGELERLMARLRRPAAGAAPVIVLAGDIHIAAALTLRGGHGLAAVPQWISSAASTGSSLAARVASFVALRATNLATRWPVRHHFADLRNNFGVVEVELGGAAPRATFESYVWDGARTLRAHSVSVALSHVGD